MRKGKRVTRKDVAQQAGVSTATISYVINNGPRPVAAETRERVLRIIGELGYYPNELARSLRVRQSLTIGLVIPDLMNPFYTGLAHSLEELCFARGYTMIVCSTNREAGKEQRFAELLRAKQVDGTVFLPDTGSLEAIMTLRDAHVPVVILENNIPGLHCVAIDDFRGGTISTEYLIKLGHRRIGFIHQQPNHTTSTLRLSGYRAALTKAGIEADDSLIVACRSGHSDGAAAMNELLPLNVTAVCAHNDVIALGAMHTIRQSGRTIPGDISVIGYDDIASAAFYAPSLTTISYPKEAMAKWAAQRLFALIDLDSDYDAPAPVTELLPVRLIARQSTAPV